MSGPIPKSLIEAQWLWLKFYCSLSGETPEEILANYDVVPCHCGDVHCKGWKLDHKMEPWRDPGHESDPNLH